MKKINLELIEGSQGNLAHYRIVGSGIFGQEHYTLKAKREKDGYSLIRKNAENSFSEVFGTTRNESEVPNKLYDEAKKTAESLGKLKKIWLRGKGINSMKKKLEFLCQILETNGFSKEEIYKENVRTKNKVENRGFLNLGLHMGIGLCAGVFLGGFLGYKINPDVIPLTAMIGAPIGLFIGGAIYQDQYDEFDGKYGGEDEMYADHRHHALRGKFEDKYPEKMKKIPVIEST